jgi:NADP-dependent 3-hydroxy acid dehydrogenase YdfG
MGITICRKTYSYHQALVVADVYQTRYRLEALVMNAGGMGGKNPGQKNGNGVTQMFASNVLGMSFC